MKINFLSFIAQSIAFIMLLFSAAPALRADTPIVIVVTNGAPAPDGNGTINIYIDFFNANTCPVVINDAGQVAFRAELNGTTGGSNSSGIYRSDTFGNLTAIVRQGQATPDGNGSFSNLVQTTTEGASPPTLNGAGQVAFEALLGGTSGGSNNYGLFRGSGGVVTQIVRSGWVAPDGNGSYVGGVLNTLASGGFPASPPLNGSGQLAFYDILTGATNSGEGIFRGNGGDRTSITQIFRNYYNYPPFGGFSDISTPALNDLGQLAYWAENPGGVNTSGVFRADGATLTRIADSYELVPDGNGIFSRAGFSSAALNNGGEVAFSDGVGSTVGGSNNFGIFRGDGSTLTQIVRSDQTVPGGNGYFGMEGSYVEMESLNNPGQVVFSAKISGTIGGTNQSGIYRGDGVTLTKIARQGDPAPESNNTLFSSLLVNSAPTEIVAVNDSGQVAFLASLSDGNVGLYLYDDHIGLIKVIRTGDTLLGRTVTGLRFNSYYWLGGEGRGLNNRGQVAFSFTLNGSPTYGIAVWNAPEFQITDIRTVTNDVRLTWNTIAGRTNVVQVALGGMGGSYSTNNFTDLSSNIVVTGVGQASTNYFDIGGATNKPARYYRVRLVP